VSWGLLVLALAPQQSTGVDAELVRALAADVRAWRRSPELPAAEDLAAVRAEAERLGPPQELVRELANLGHRLDQAGRGPEARALVAWAGERSLAAEDLSMHSWALEWLGQDAWGRGELELAATLLSGAAASDARRGAGADQARQLADVARIRLVQGRLAEAEVEIARAEEVARAARSELALRSAAAIRASLLLELGRHREVLELCRTHARGTRQDELEVRFDILAADALADVGRLDTAVFYARRALTQAQAPTITRTAPLLHLEPRLTLALLLGDLGQTDEALALLDEGAAEFARLGDARGVAWTDKNRGFALYAAGRFAEAVPAFERAWRAGAELGVPFLQGFGALGLAEALARIEERGPADEERLRAALASAARVAEQSHERTLVWRVAALRGALLLARGEPEAALVELRRAVTRIERWRRRLGASGLIEHALRQRSDPYRDAAFAAAHAGRPEEALRYAALLQARVLDELRARRDEELPAALAPELAPLAEHIARTEARLRRAAPDDAGALDVGANDVGANTELERELAAAEDALDAALLAAELDSGRLLAAPAEPVPLARLGAALEEQGFALALAFLVGTEETLVLSIAAGAEAGLAARVLPVGRAWLETRSERLRTPLERLEAGELDLAHLGFDVRAARELYDALIRPLALPPGARLALVLDGVLAAIPFELFVSGGSLSVFDPARPFAHLADLRYLADQHELVLHGSLARLVAPVPARAGESVLFLAPQALGVTHAEDEARALERALGSVQIVRDARPEDVRALAPGAAMLHFAVHGRLDPARPAHGHLVLGGPDGAAARLEGWQAAELPLAGATVVLSACHTGRGEWRAGAGLAGLTRGFLGAGAREVIASQWAVEDRAGVRFMEFFHAARARGLDTPAALGAARAALRHGTRRNGTDVPGEGPAHPAFWAGWFVQR
jgi:tetratricopeptide (TPR) repeat protein